MATVRKSAESDKAGWVAFRPSLVAIEPENIDDDSRGASGPGLHKERSPEKVFLRPLPPDGKHQREHDSAQQPFACPILIAGARD